MESHLVGCFIKASAHCIAQFTNKLILLPQHPEAWIYRLVPPHLTDYKSGLFEESRVVCEAAVQPWQPHISQGLEPPLVESLT